MSVVMELEPLRAGLEDFFPLLVFFFIWLISSRREKRKRLNQDQQGVATTSKTMGPPNKAPKVEGEIDPFDVLRQMMFGGIEMPPMSPPQPPQPDEISVADLSGAPQGIAEWKVEQPLPQAPLNMAGVSIPSQAEVRKLAVRKVSPEPVVPPKQGGLAPFVAQTPRRELQRAFVWSEVLAPPVALRDTSS